MTDNIIQFEEPVLDISYYRTQANLIQEELETAREQIERQTTEIRHLRAEKERKIDSSVKAR